MLKCKLKADQHWVCEPRLTIKVKKSCFGFKRSAVSQSVYLSLTQIRANAFSNPGMKCGICSKTAA